MERTIFSAKIDYLIAVTIFAVGIWAFYGVQTAIGGAVVLIAIANLQPIRRLGISRNAATMLGVSLLLILSVGAKLIDRDGYCYALLGPQRQMVDFINMQVPCFVDNDFYSDTSQPGGMGLVRDIALPLVGLGLGLLVIRNLREDA